MADNQEKTEDFIVLNKKGTRPFFYAKAAMATEVKSSQDFSVLF
jgi:hypothetical protein